jgi:hypothetical protein
MDFRRHLRVLSREIEAEGALVASAWESVGLFLDSMTRRFCSRYVLSLYRLGFSLWFLHFVFFIIH